MTQPDVYGPEVPDEEGLALEVAAVTAVTTGLVTAVSGFLAALYGAWELTTPATRLLFGQMISNRIRALAIPPMNPRLRRWADDAETLGQEQALHALPGAPRHAETDRLPALDVPDLDTAVRFRLRRAVLLAEVLDFARKEDVHSVAGAVRQAQSRAEGAVRWTVNAGVNRGGAAVAQGADLRLIWVAERNACLTCLAHAGWAVTPGDLFPALTFDPALRDRVIPVRWPPAHPGCRCRVRPYDGPAGPPPLDRSQVNPAARLAAEARRSAVYQWSDYASGPAARRAALQLLEGGAALPVTVEKRARTALRAGRAVRRPR